MKQHDNQNNHKISKIGKIVKSVHCVKSVQIRSFFWFLFSGIGTEYGEIQSIFPQWCFSYFHFCEVDNHFQNCQIKEL